MSPPKFSIGGLKKKKVTRKENNKMKKIFFILSLGLFIVCCESPRDQCEERRVRNNNDETGLDCAGLYLIFNIDDPNKNLSEKEKAVRDSNRSGYNAFIFDQCLQASLAAGKCRKTKPGFSIR